jgi:hypothetical protein
MKIIKNSVLSLICLFIITSCSTDNVNESNVDNQLQKQLLDFNNNLPKNDNNQYRWGWGRILAVAGADLIGAGTGVWAVKEIGAAAGTFTGGTGTAIVYAGAGIICGGGASYTASQNVHRMGTFSKTTNDEFNIDIRFPENYSFYDIGNKHNESLNLCFFGTTSTKDYLSQNYTPEVINYMYNQPSWNTINEYVLNSANSYNQDFDYNKHLNKIYSDKYISENMYLTYQKFMDAYTKAQTEEEIENIINFYSESIANSKISEIEKIALLSSMSVSAKSTNYWYHYE